MDLLANALISLTILSMVLLAIRLIRLDGGNIIFQFAAMAALSTAVLGFMEIQIIQSTEHNVLLAIQGLYSLNAAVILCFGLCSVMAFVNPFKNTRLKQLTQYQYHICVLPILFIFYQLGFNQVVFAKDMALLNGLWYFSFDYASLTSKVFSCYFTIGVLLMTYCFWVKLKSINKTPGKLDKKIILLVISVLPIATVIYFLIYASNYPVPFLASLPISICVGTLSWTYADFNIFQVNSNLAQDEILESMANSMVITDLNYNIVEINTEAKKILNQEKENLLGLNILDLVKMEEFPNWKNLVSAISESPSKKYSGEFSIERNNQLRQYLLSISPIFSKSKRRSGLLFLALDLTEEKEREAAIKKKSAALQKSHLELERFAHIASHDLKTPLRNVVSFLDLIERKVVKYNDKELKEFTYLARQGASQMYHLIQDVLEYSKVNNEEKEKKHVDLNETVFKICTNLRAQMIEKNVEISVAEMPTITGEQNHMTQLFTNLIENGIKYNNQLFPNININHRLDNGQHVFAVADNGIGIEKQYYQQIFQMFKRLHTSSNYEGSGIGLSICKKIIDLYQGEIWLESKPTEGSVFFFTLSMN